MDFAVLIGVVCGIANIFIAKQKGRSEVGWFLLGFVFGVFGTIALLIVKPIKRCDHCKGKVPVDAVKCKHCGTDL